VERFLPSLIVERQLEARLADADLESAELVHVLLNKS